MTSKIFTVAEIEAIEKREGGDKTDTTGIFHGRVKPKIEDILRLLGNGEMIKTYQIN